MRSVTTKFFLFLYIFFSETVYSQDNSFTRRETIPLLAWDPYGWNITHDKWIPEDVFKANVDWFAKEFVPYGYSIIRAAAWAGTDSATMNEYGYRSRYRAAWKNDWKYWVDYLNKHKLKMVIYQWDIAAVKQDHIDKGVIIEGTNIPIASIADASKPIPWGKGVVC